VLQEVEVLRIFRQQAHESGKVMSPIHWPPLPSGDTRGPHFCQRFSQSQDHSAAGRLKSMKNHNDPIGKRTRNFPACSAVPQLNCAVLRKATSGASFSIEQHLVDICLLKFQGRTKSNAMQWSRFLRKPVYLYLNVRYEE
jgi:hypothetical protein